MPLVVIEVKFTFLTILYYLPPVHTYTTIHLYVPYTTSPITYPRSGHSSLPRLAASQH